MKSFIRDLALQLLVVLLAGVLIRMFSIDISSILGIRTIIWDNISIVALVVAASLLVARRYAIRNRRTSISIIGEVRRRPSNMIKSFRGIFYRVRWRIFYGAQYSFPVDNTKAYAFAEGHYCPECDYELDEKDKNGLLGIRGKHVWWCPQCNKDYNRGKNYPYEKDVVQKRVEAGIRSGGVRVYKNEFFEEAIG